MPARVDPTVDALVVELRRIRTGRGEPGPERLAGCDELIDCLGLGSLEHAWETLQRLYDQHGQDPETNIGAYFYTAGWRVGRDSMEQRLQQYTRQFHVSATRTPLRRSNAGAADLAQLIRDYSEHSRPWGFIFVFQSGPTADAICRFYIARESWRPPTIQVDGEPIPVDATHHRDPDRDGALYSQVIVPRFRLKLDVGPHEDLATVDVQWPMPVWPSWQLLTYLPDPRILGRMRTYRNRAVQIGLQWSHVPPPEDVDGLALARDGAVWGGDAPHVRHIALPDGWRADQNAWRASPEGPTKLPWRAAESPWRISR